MISTYNLAHARCVGEEPRVRFPRARDPRGKFGVQRLLRCLLACLACVTLPELKRNHLFFQKKKKKWLYTLQLTLFVLSSVITAWNPSDPNSHVLGGFQFHNGELTIPYTGRYYVYAQMYFCNRPSRHRNRVLVSAGNRILLMMNKDIPGDGIDLTASAGGVFVLSAGERLSVQATMYDTKLYLSRHHCYFGAYMVSA